MGGLGGLGGSWGTLGGLGGDLGALGAVGLGGLGGTGGRGGGGWAWGTWGSGRIAPWQIWARPPPFSGGRAGLGHSQNPSDPMPQAWIWALRRPSKKSEGRELVRFLRVGQILAGQGPGPTLRNRWGSTQNWAWPNLARPLGPSLGPGWARGLWDPKLGTEKHEVVEGLFPQWTDWGPPQGKWIVWYPGDLWAGPFPPNPTWKNGFTGISPFPEKSLAPLGPRGDPYWPLVELFPIWPPAAL